jgi:hypothetical protein
MAAKLSDPRANVLKASIPELQSGQIPIIAVSSQAPDPDAAARLANEAIAVLQSQLASVANTDRVPSQRRVIVRQLGRAHASVESRGPGKKLAVLVAVFVFAFGCGTILAVVALVGGWRQASAFERSLEPEYGPELVPGDEDRPAYREGAEPPLEPAAPDHAGWTFPERHGGAVGKQRT